MIGRALIGLVHWYQRYLSPVLGANCRFVPTCSQYAVDCLEGLPLYRALPLVVWRILRCNPWGTAGLDPAPTVKGAHEHRRRSER